LALRSAAFTSPPQPIGPQPATSATTTNINNNGGNSLPPVMETDTDPPTPASQKILNVGTWAQRQQQFTVPRPQNEKNNNNNNNKNNQQQQQQQHYQKEKKELPSHTDLWSASVDRKYNLSTGRGGEILGGLVSRDTSYVDFVPGSSRKYKTDINGATNEDRIKDNFELNKERDTEGAIDSQVDTIDNNNHQLEKNGIDDDDDDDDSEVGRIEQAWRYRFTKRWKRAQQRAAFLPRSDSGIHPNADDPELSIQYVQACGPQLQQPPPPPLPSTTSHPVLPLPIAPCGSSLGGTRSRHHHHRQNHVSMGAMSNSTIGGQECFLHPSDSSVSLLFDPDREEGEMMAMMSPAHSGQLNDDDVKEEEVVGEKKGKDKHVDHVDVSDDNSTTVTAGTAGTKNTSKSQKSTTKQAYSATQDVNRLASRGWDSVAVQEQLETKAQARWAPEPEWVGKYLTPAVDIDRWGRFKFAVIRVTESGTGRRRFLVRGGNSMNGSGGGGVGGGIITPVDLAAQVAEAAAAAATQMSLRPVTVELLGAGDMEWREDTGRQLTLSAQSMDMMHLGYDATGNSSSGSSNGLVSNVCGLAASLLRQELPCHYKIVVALSL
jgi:hypothetical protein